jgi:PadR family transcriptional regulator PadR
VTLEEMVLQDLNVELKKGVTVLIVLSCLRKPQYGYRLSKDLESRGVPIEMNTLYPLLRKLEKQELLESSWNTNHNQPRKFYRRTALGTNVFMRLREAWDEMTGAVDRLLKSEGIINER